MKIDTTLYNNYYNRNIHRRAFVPNFSAHGIFPGCFDPITLGHIDIIKRASKICDSVTVLVSKNPAKEKSFLSVADRVSLIKKVLEDEKLVNVNVAYSSDFAVNYANHNNDTIIVRGLRNGDDFQYEMDMFKISNKIDPNIDIIFLPTRPNLSEISSTEVRKRFESGIDISSIVPKYVMEFLNNLNKNYSKKYFYGF